MSLLWKLFQVNGFRSPSLLFGLPGFSIPLGVSIDYMHGVCLGVVKTLVSLWFDSSNTGKKWYCGELVHQVDSRLLSIKPPSAITRVPRSIDSHRKHWKGKFTVLTFNVLILWHCFLLERCPVKDYGRVHWFYFLSNLNQMLLTPKRKRLVDLFCVCYTFVHVSAWATIFVFF